MSCRRCVRSVNAMFFNVYDWFQEWWLLKKNQYQDLLWCCCFVCFFVLFFWGAGTETRPETSGHTLQITGTSVGGKVVTTKLPLPANSKIVTVNVPTSQGGTDAFNKVWFIQCGYFFFPSTAVSGCTCVCVFIAAPHIQSSDVCWMRQLSQVESDSLIGSHWKQSGMPTVPVPLWNDCVCLHSF